MENADPTAENNYDGVEANTENKEASLENNDLVAITENAESSFENNEGHVETVINTEIVEASIENNGDEIEPVDNIENLEQNLFQDDGKRKRTHDIIELNPELSKKLKVTKELLSEAGNTLHSMQSTGIHNGNSTSELTEIMEIAPDKVGQVIGSKGAVIQDIQSRSGCKMYVKQDFPAGENRQVIFTGNAAQINAAKELVNLIIEEGPTAIRMLDGPIIVQEIDCPQALVGRVIGGGGVTIKELQSRCGAKVQINQNFPDGVPRKITITGNEASVQQAIQLVDYVMNHGPSLPPLQHHMSIGGMGMGIGMGMGMGMGGYMYGSPNASIENMSSPSVPGMVCSTIEPMGDGGSFHQIISCPKSVIGKIIGKKGDIINSIQSRSGCRLQVDQNVPEGHPVKINLAGQMQSILVANQLIHDVLNNSYRPNNNSMNPHFSMQQNFAPFATQHIPGAMQQGYPVGNGIMSPQYYAPQYGAMADFGMSSGMNGQMMNGMFGAVEMAPQQGGGGIHGLHAQGQGAGYGASVPAASNGWQQQQQQQQSHSQKHVPPTTYSAPASKPSSLPPGWAEHKTDDGTPYYYNTSTAVSQVPRRIDSSIMIARLTLSVFTVCLLLTFSLFIFMHFIVGEALFLMTGPRSINTAHKR